MEILACGQELVCLRDSVIRGPAEPQSPLLSPTPSSQQRPEGKKGAQDTGQEAEYPEGVSVHQTRKQNLDYSRMVTS